MPNKENISNITNLDPCISIKFTDWNRKTDKMKESEISVLDDRSGMSEAMHVSIPNSSYVLLHIDNAFIMADDLYDLLKLRGYTI